MDQALTRWFLLPLPAQMVNIGNEVKRAFRFSDIPQKRQLFLSKAISYVVFSMQDPKNQKAVPELKICREVLEDCMGERKLDCSEEQISRYFQYYMYLMKPQT